MSPEDVESTEIGGMSAKQWYFEYKWRVWQL
jgi:hypothetical protein